MDVVSAADFIPHVLRNPSSTLELSLLPYGLTFHSLVVSAEKQPPRDILVGYEDPRDHHYDRAGGRGFFNQVVGRYANRIPSNLGTWCGMKFSLDPAEDVCLHGGKNGLDTQAWRRLEFSRTTLFSKELSASTCSKTSQALYCLLSRGAADGFPGDLFIEVLITLADGKDDTGSEEALSLGNVSVIMRATLEVDHRPFPASEVGTPVNLTLHLGFNLGPFDGKENEDVLGHKLYLNSTTLTALDRRGLATGEIEAIIEGGQFDYQSSSGLWDRTISSSLDHNFLLDSSAVTKLAGRDHPVAAELRSPDDSISLVFHTNQSSVQVYTANEFSGEGSRKPRHRVRLEHKGVGYEKHGAVFLEFQHPVGTFLHPKLIEHAKTSTIVKPGDVYENNTDFELLVRNT